MKPEEHEDTAPHSLERPPAPATEVAERIERFEFAIVRPDRPGQVPAAMAKRPARKE